jgi:hypothetical protein
MASGQGPGGANLAAGRTESAAKTEARSSWPGSCASGWPVWAPERSRSNRGARVKTATAKASTARSCDVNSSMTLPALSRYSCPCADKTARRGQCFEPKAKSLVVRPRLVFPESWGGFWVHQSSLRSFNADHDSYSELPLHLQREAGRSITRTIDFRLTRVYSGYPACEPTALACLASRSFQYRRTANFLAMATLATALPRRNFRRK